MSGEIKLLCYLIVVVLIVIGFFLIMKGSSENKIRDNIGKIIGRLNKEYQKKSIKSITDAYLKDNKKTLLSRLNLLIERSSIKNYIPFFSGALLVCCMLILVVIFYTASKLFIENIYIQLEAAFLGIMIPIMALKQLEKIEFNKIDDNLIFLINTAKGFSETKNELTYIFYNTGKHLTEPLKSIVEQFVNEIQHGISINLAAENVKEKVNNIRLQTLFRHLATASKSTADGDYTSILEFTAESYEKLYEKKQDRKSKAAQGRGAVVFITVCSAIVIGALNANFPSTKDFLLTNQTGQLLVAFFGAIYVYAIYILFKLDDFNY